MKSKAFKYHGLSAKELLTKLKDEEGFDLTPPIDVEKILQLLDIKYSEEIDFDRIDIAGSISIVAGNPLIWINPIQNDYYPRKRFTIAHEIGHLILHINPEIGIKEFIDTQKTLNRKDSYWNIKEYEANNFAAQLLMPAELILTYGNNIIQDYLAKQKVETMPQELFIKEMANLFKVSEPAMTYRLKNMGALN